VIWKPSEATPLTALAAAAILNQAIAEQGAPPYLSQVLLGGADVGTALVDHPGVALLSATGSTRMGRAVGPRVAARFGRALLELGGNNAAVVAPSADLDLTVRGIVFAAAGTAGQRCTTMRRLTSSPA
jgi:aldehyde dehydrogenase (NAD+)